MPLMSTFILLSSFVYSRHTSAIASTQPHPHIIPSYTGVGATQTLPVPPISSSSIPPSGPISPHHQWQNPGSKDCFCILLAICPFVAFLFFTCTLVPATSGGLVGIATGRELFCVSPISELEKLLLIWYISYSFFGLSRPPGHNRALTQVEGMIVSSASGSLSWLSPFGISDSLFRLVVTVS